MKRILGVLIMFSILSNTQLFSKDEYAPKYRTIFSEKNKLAPFIYYKKGGDLDSGYTHNHPEERAQIQREIVPIVQTLMSEIKENKYDFLRNNLSRRIINSISDFYKAEQLSNDAEYISRWIEDIKKFKPATAFRVHYLYQNRSYFEKNQIVAAIEPIKYTADPEKDLNDKRTGFIVAFFDSKSKRMAPCIIGLHKDEGSYKIEEPSWDDEQYFLEYYNNKIND